MRLAYALLFIAGTACAQWPSIAHQYSGFERGSQSLSGAVERLAVVSGPMAYTNYATTNIFKDHYSQWARCQAAKNILRAAVDTGMYLYADAGLMPTGAVITASGLLSRIGAPPNWWTNTPHYNLASETNGWMLIPNAMSNVVWVKAHGWGHTNDIYAVSVVYSGTSYDDAYASAQSVYPESIITNSYYKPQSFVFMVGSNYFGYSSYAAELERHHGDVFSVLSSDSVQFEASCTLYLKTTNNILFSPSESYYDAQGDSVSQAYTNLVSWVNSVGAVTGTAVRIGDYSMVSAPLNYIVPSDDYWATTGWEIEDLCTILKYNLTTNGFKWFK